MTKNTSWKELWVKVHDHSNKLRKLTDLLELYDNEQCIHT